jgi:hypothetical protein
MARHVDARDAIALLGLGLLATGLAMVSVPLALIVTGALLFAAAVVPSLLPPKGA